MSSGNHIADQAQKENDKRGACPQCGRGLLQPAQMCVQYKEQCVANCDDTPEDCKVMGMLVDAVQCPICEYIAKAE